MLPVYFDENTHPYLMRIVRSYRPHTPIPSRQELLQSKYELDGHCSLQGLVEQCDMDYNNEIRNRMK